MAQLISLQSITSLLYVLFPQRHSLFNLHAYLTLVWCVETTSVYELHWDNLRLSTLKYIYIP